MKNFKIYAGLGGGYGDAVYLYTKEFENKQEASNAAFKEACDIFDSFLKALPESKAFSKEIREIWLDYYVEEEE